MPRNGRASLDDIVASYIREVRPAALAEQLFYEQQLSFDSVVMVAALSKNADGKRHSHQRRIPGPSLAEAHNRLRFAPLAECESFDDLHGLVRSATSGIPKIGALAVYDIAHRIGAHLKLYPAKVYLHCGTRVGARWLGFRRRDTLDVCELPVPFHQLSAAENEDCLCIYKDEIRKAVDPG